MTNKHFTVKELPLSERPYERCETYGPRVLTDAELIAVIIRTGTKKERSIEIANRILDACHQQKGLLGLHHFTIQELMKIDGIGKVKAIQLQCVAELSKRMARTNNKKDICFNTPEIVSDYYMQEMRNLDREQIVIVMIDSKSRRIKDMVISMGTVNASIAAPREVFRCAMKHDAVSIILLHNHPSGDPSPSKEDLIVTNRMKDAGHLIGIPLMDHIIIGDNQYISLKEKGMI